MFKQGEKVQYNAKQVTLKNVNIKGQKNKIKDGGLPQSNLKHNHSLHQFCKAGTKLSTFKKNISSLSIYSSYHIWLCRSDPIFIQPPYLKPTFDDQLTRLRKIFQVENIWVPQKTKPCPWSYCRKLIGIQLSW